MVRREPGLPPTTQPTPVWGLVPEAQHLPAALLSCVGLGLTGLTAGSSQPVRPQIWAAQAAVAASVMPVLELPVLVERLDLVAVAVALAVA